MNSQQLPHRGTPLSQTVTGGANIVPTRNHPSQLLLASRLLRFLRTSLWPLTVVAVGVLACIAWSAALFWLVTYALWYAVG